MDIARKLRIWFLGAVYYIMQRGVRRKPIYPFKSGKSTDDKLSGRLSLEQLSDNDRAF